MCVGNFYIAFRFVFIVFFETNLRIIYTYLYIVHQKSLKIEFKTTFSIHNIHMNLCGQLENLQWILCSRKKDLNVAVLCADSICFNPENKHCRIVSP